MPCAYYLALGIKYHLTYSRSLYRLLMVSAGSFLHCAALALGIANAVDVELPDGTWEMTDDFSRPDGSIYLKGPKGQELTMTRYLEWYGTPETTFLGLNSSDVLEAANDILADELLKNGDPDRDQISGVLPPVGSVLPASYPGWLEWTAFVATVNSTEVMPGSYVSRTNYEPAFYIEDYGGHSPKSEGFLGGATPIIVTHYPLGSDQGSNATSYVETLFFADMGSSSERLFPTYTRQVVVKDGKASDPQYSGPYRTYGGFRKAPTEEEFNQALLRTYFKWQEYLSPGLRLKAPETDTADFALHAFAKEGMTRGRGITPRYGAVDRDYDGTEYDGFQDIFTGSLRANMDWGRMDMAKALIVDQFENVVTDDGLPSMRGPETGQFGLELALLARYGNLTGDWATLSKYESKIKAKAKVLTTLHDEALGLSSSDPGYGLIHGWSESDACLNSDPNIWWKPYYGNTGLAARGLKDIATVWGNIGGDGSSSDWSNRADKLQNQLVLSLNASIWYDMSPPYVPTMPGSNQTWYDSMTQASNDGTSSDQQWGHRVYVELLQSGVLPSDLENAVLDSLRAHHGTTVGVTCNFVPPTPDDREFLGFISYGHAQALLRQDRIEEFLLFFYSHRFNVHTRGSWTGSETSGPGGGLTFFCLPAQMTGPTLLRWAFVYDDDNDNTLHLARGLPKKWLNDSDGVSISDVPSRWGSTGFSLKYDAGSNAIKASVDLPSEEPGHTYLYLRLPNNQTVDCSKFKNTSILQWATNKNGVPVISIAGSGQTKNFTVPLTASSGNATCPVSSSVNGTSSVKTSKASKVPPYSLKTSATSTGNSTAKPSAVGSSANITGLPASSTFSSSISSNVSVTGPALNSATSNVSATSPALSSALSNVSATGPALSSASSSGSVTGSALSAGASSNGSVSLPSSLKSLKPTSASTVVSGTVSSKSDESSGISSSKASKTLSALSSPGASGVYSNVSSAGSGSAVVKYSSTTLSSESASSSELTSSVSASPAVGSSFTGKSPEIASSVSAASSSSSKGKSSGVASSVGVGPAPSSTLTGSGSATVISFGSVGSKAGESSSVLKSVSSESGQRGTLASVTTTVVSSFTTVCPSSTELTYNGHTYTATGSTTLTITDCPCTLTRSGTGTLPTGSQSVASASSALPEKPSSSEATNGFESSTTVVVSSFTTYCPSSTEFTFNGKTYTATDSTTLTITDCPCTLTKGGPTTAAPVDTAIPGSSFQPQSSGSEGTSSTEYAPKSSEIVESSAKSVAAVQDSSSASLPMANGISKLVPGVSAIVASVIVALLL